MAGRKSLKDEIQVVRYLAELTPKAFGVIDRFLKSEKDVDQKWATEQLMKLISKAIPTEMVGEGGGALQVAVVKYDSTTTPVQPETVPTPTA